MDEDFNKIFMISKHTRMWSSWKFISNSVAKRSQLKIWFSTLQSPSFNVWKPRWSASASQFSLQNNKNLHINENSRNIFNLYTRHWRSFQTIVWWNIDHGTHHLCIHSTVFVWFFDKISPISYMSLTLFDVLVTKKININCSQNLKIQKSKFNNFYRIRTFL